MRHLFIVSRDQPALFAYLSREFAGEPEVTVILDRRQGQRRSPEDAEPADGDRQQTDRRAAPGLVRQLSTLGYAFVRLAPPVPQDV
jgi:hypothetical protein